MSDDYMKEYIEDVAKDLGGKQPGEVAGELKKHMLIKEYIDRATEGMTGQRRNDVARELKTHILDSADALAAERKMKVDEAIVSEVIAKMGPANKLASMYPEKKMLTSGIWKVVKGLGIVALMFMAVAIIIWLVAPDVFIVPGIVALNVIFALIIAIVVISAILFIVNVYEVAIKDQYKERLHQIGKDLKDDSSPLKVGLTIGGTVLWLAIINLFWQYIPFLPDFSEKKVVVLEPLLTPEFGQFLLYINILGVLVIAVQILYLALKQKWVPALLEAGLTFLNALLFYWIFIVFPFNPGYNAYVHAGIKIMLALIMFGCLIGTAQHLWHAVKYFLQAGTEKREAV